jgi:hypothetical protein
MVKLTYIVVSLYINTMRRMCGRCVHKVALITQQAMKAGFTGGLVVDFPNSAKAKK